MSNITTKLIYTLLFAFFALPLQAQTPVVNEDFELTSSDLFPNDFFGLFTTIHEGKIAVSSRSSQSDEYSGAVFVFDSVTGTELLKIVPENQDPANGFGKRVAMDDNFVVVGSFSASSTVYIFDASTGEQTSTLVSPRQDPVEADFGFDLSIDQGILAIAGPQGKHGEHGSGTVYLFDAATSTLIREIRPEVGNPDELFGYSVDIHAGVLAVGAVVQDPITFFSVGAIYLFDAKSGEELHRLEIGLGAGFFGTNSVAIEGSTLVASSMSDWNGTDSVDAFYIYDIPSGTQIARVENPNPVVHDYYANTVSISNGIVAAGAGRFRSWTKGPGAVYLYDAITGDQIAKLAPEEEKISTAFASVIAIENGIVAASMSDRYDPYCECSHGSVFVFNINCRADLNADKTLDFFDISAFLTAFSTTDPLADFNQDGQYDFFDISAFLTAYAAGCP